MSVSIAKKPIGFCVCGGQVEPGEQFTTQGGAAVHVGCESKSQSGEPEPSVWTLTAVPDPRPQTPRFAPVSLDDGQQTNTPRLMGQLGRTYDLMSDGKWWTLIDLAHRLGALETSAGARLRDLRKREHGGHMVLCRVRADGSGVREYRLLLTRTKGAIGAA